MLGYVIEKARRKGEAESPDAQVPPDLRHRLRPWVDVDEVGMDGFWIWVRAVVPLLPHPEPAPTGVARLGRLGGDDLKDLRQRIVVYARENSRLTVLCEYYSKDNHALARRLKALEAALRTLEIAGHRIEIPADDEAESATDRYLPARRRRKG